MINSVKTIHKRYNEPLKTIHKGYNECLKTIRKDYADFLNEYGFTQDFVDTILNMNTVDDNDPKSLLEIRDSLIEGKGMFSIRDIEKNEYIAMGRVNGERVLAGRYINHAPDPNAIFVLMSNGDLFVQAKCSIIKDTEVTIDYRQAGKVNGYNKTT